MTTIDLDLGSPVLEAYAADRVLHVRLANGRTSTGLPRATEASAVSS